MTPALIYFGGKYRLAAWIIDHFPPHKNYVEPYCGAASVMLAKPRSKGEVINDLNGDIVNLFRILRDPTQAVELERQLRLTPYAREEYLLSWVPSLDPLERARRMVIRSMTSYAGRQTQRTGFRSREIMQNGPHKAQTWANYPDNMRCITERLKGVCIENRPAVEIIRGQDHPETLFYIDPPYVMDTRQDTHNNYLFEMSDQDHRELAELLRTVQGKVIISGYDCDLYRELYAGWETDQVKSRVSRGKERTRMETIWMNFTNTKRLL